MTHDNPQLVIVRWHDAEADTGWDDRDESCIKDLVLVDSVGYLIAENEHSLLLVADIDPNNGSNRALSIPRVCVKTVDKLREQVAS
jgi:hypothetical protein